MKNQLLSGLKKKDGVRRVKTEAVPDVDV